MSRKTLIICLALIAFLVLGTGAAVTLLYSGLDGNRVVEVKLSGDGKHSLLNAVPSDVVLVGCFDNASKAKIKIDSIDVPEVPVVVSMHYSGRLVPLYVLDVHKMADDAVSLVTSAKERGLCAASQEGVVMISESETLVRSSLRHISENISILQTEGFADALSSSAGRDALIISNLHFSKIFPSIFPRKLSSKASFFESLADWTVLVTEKSRSGSLHIKGTSLFEDNASEFMTVLMNSSYSISSAADVLPSYTLFAASLPFKDISPYMSAYRSYLDSRQELQRYQARQRELESRNGISPDAFFRSLDVREVATASFILGDKIQRVNLIRAEKCDVSIIFKGTDVTSLKKYAPCVHQWAYPSYASASLGGLFALPDESCFTYIDGWIVTGSNDAVSEYAQGRALSYTLREFMDNAGKSEIMSASEASFVSYFSFTENKAELSEFFRQDALAFLSQYYDGCDTAPAELYVTPSKDGMELDFTISRHTLTKTKAPEFERDTTVIIPKGPFKVRNSHTGKTNLFYQNSHNALCLQDEKGKDIWGIPFKQPICGAVHEVDYFGNGKLQYIFAAGSNVYIIDRLSRFVKGFPIDLGRRVLLGPDVYDFSGAGKYNIVVLHNDNTIQMYNLKGQKPSLWKGISPEHKVKSLPERIVLGGNNFWVVRTSVETIIYPFYGGQPLTSFEGDRKIRPDSQIEVIDGASVKVLCYDGKHRSVKLK